MKPHLWIMRAALTLASLPAAADAARTPPRPPEMPSFRPPVSADPVPAIFVYRIDAGCQVTGTRKLSGPAALSWRDVQRQRQIEQRQVVWRIVDGVRSQLIERRVKLRGELVREGELVCHLRPGGQVLEAWIERRDQSAARRQAPQRDAVAVIDGGIADLGAYSLTIETGG
ncbi:MAG: hypothetical protein RIB46_03030 [Pseudomonadales bacterium]